MLLFCSVSLQYPTATSILFSNVSCGTSKPAGRRLARCELSITLAPIELRHACKVRRSILVPLTHSGIGPLSLLSYQAKKAGVTLVHQVSEWCSGAAANFGWMREAKKENTRCGL
jgi:hypothetical protein